MCDIRWRFTCEALAEKLSKVGVVAADEEIDTAIVHRPPNLSGFTEHNGWSFYALQTVVEGASSEPVWFNRKVDADRARCTSYLKPHDTLLDCFYSLRPLKSVSTR